MPFSFVWPLCLRRTFISLEQSPEAGEVLDKLNALESLKVRSKRGHELGDLRAWYKLVQFIKASKMILFIYSLTGFHLAFNHTNLLKLLLSKPPTTPYCQWSLDRSAFSSEYWISAHSLIGFPLLAFRTSHSPFLKDLLLPSLLCHFLLPASQRRIS